MQQHPLIKEYLDIIFRRRWWIILPALAGVVLSVVLFFNFDKLFKASTRVQIRAQTVSRQLLNPIVDINARDLVTPIQAELNSEKYIKEIDARLHLVGSPGGPHDIGELTKLIMGNVEVTPNPKNNYFDLDVTWRDPQTAADIANLVAGFYIERSKGMRQDIASKTLDQLRGRRAEIEKELGDIRAQMEKLRSEHKFELAGREQTNLEIMRADNAEIERLDTDIRNHQAAIKDAQIKLQAPVIEGPASAADPRVDALREKRNERAQLMSQGKTDLYPRVRILNQEIADLEKQLNVSGDGTAQPFDPARAQLENEIARLKGEITAGRARQQRLRADVAVVQQRLDRTPDWQIQLDALDAKEKSLAQEYDDARKKEADANAGVDAEGSGFSERFEVLTPARPNPRPFWPDIRLFLAMGVIVGAGFGIAVVLLLEVFDQSFKSEEQLAASIDVPILAVIPDLTRVPGDSRKRGGRRSHRHARTA